MLFGWRVAARRRAAPGYTEPALPDDGCVLTGARGRFPAPAAWAARRLDRTRPTGFALTLTAVAGAVCAWIFAVLAQDVHTATGSVRLDPVVERFVVVPVSAECSTTTTLQRLEAFG